MREAPLRATRFGLVPDGDGWFVLNAAESRWRDFGQLGAGESLVIVEGEERPLRAWDFVHCPGGTAHVIVGAGDGPSVVLTSSPGWTRAARSETIPRGMDPFALVDAMREALERRDADRLAAVLHPDVELHLYSQPGVIAGREAAHTWYRQAFESRTIFEGDAAAEPGEDGSLIARGRVCWYEHGVLRDWPGQWRITFRDGLIASVTAERDTAGDAVPSS